MLDVDLSYSVEYIEVMVDKLQEAVADIVIASPYMKGGKVTASNALEPYLNEKIDQKMAYERAEGPIREFMFNQTREKDLELFLSLSKEAKPQEPRRSPDLRPGAVVRDPRAEDGVQIGFMLYLPFLVLDMVVASVLMAMGMMMLPPVVISLPFKLLLFVLVDGWELVVGSLVKSFG